MGSAMSSLSAKILMATKKTLAAYAFSCTLHFSGTALAEEGQVLYCVPELATGILGENKNDYR